MKKNQYFLDQDVQEFSAWLAQHLCDNTFQTTYIDRRTGNQIAFDSLFDAYVNYYWPYQKLDGLQPHPPKAFNFDANSIALRYLKANLDNALNERCDTATKNAAIQVMIWGGVRNNIPWLESNERGLSSLLAKVKEAICTQDTERIPSENLRFNAGMTKVYSLICDNFIIYDSRVAAALGWAIAKFCLATNRESIPKQLRFPWAPAKEAKDMESPKCRNPSIGALRFSRLRSGQFHAIWNLKASWLLEQTLNSVSSEHPFKRKVVGSPLRAIEAALFMIGYDLPKSVITEKQ